MKYTITIKSGLKFSYEAKDKDEAVSNFIDSQKRTDQLHASRNNYVCRDLDYEKMIIEVYEEIQEDSC